VGSSKLETMGPKKSELAEAAILASSEQISQIKKDISKVQIWNLELVECVRRAEEDLEVLTKENSLLTKAKKSYEENQEKLNEKISLLQSESASWKKRFDDERLSLEGLSKKVEKANQHSENLKDQLTQGEQRVQSLITRLNKFESDRVNLHKQVKELKQRAEHYQSQLLSLPQLEQDSKNYYELKRASEQLEAELSYLKEQEKQSLARLSELSVKLSDQENTSKQLNEALQKDSELMRARVRDLEQNEKKLKEQLDLEKGKFLSVKQRYFEQKLLFRDEKQKLHQGLEESTKEISVLKSNLETQRLSLASEIDVYKKKLSVQDEWIEAEKQKIKRFWDDPGAELNKRVHTLNEELNASREVVKALEADLLAKRNKISELELSIKELIQKKSQLENRVSLLEQDLEHRGKSFAAQESKLKEQLDGLWEEKKSLAAQLSEANNMVELLRAQVKSKESLKDELLASQSKVNLLSSDVEQLLKQKQELEGDKYGFVTKIKVLEGSLEKAELELERYHSKARVSEEEIYDLKTKSEQVLSDLKLQISDKSLELKNQAQEISELRRKLIDLNLAHDQEVSTFKEKIVELGSKNDQEKTKMRSELGMIISDLEAKLNSEKEKHSKTQEELSSFKYKNEQTLSDFKIQISDKSLELKNQAQEISALRVKLVELNAAHDQEKTKLRTDLESEMKSLETKLAFEGERYAAVLEEITDLKAKHELLISDYKNQICDKGLELKKQEQEVSSLRDKLVELKSVHSQDKDRMRLELESVIKGLEAKLNDEREKLVQLKFVHDQEKIKLRLEMDAAIENLEKKLADEREKFTETLSIVEKRLASDLRTQVNARNLVAEDLQKALNQEQEVSKLLEEKLSKSRAELHQLRIQQSSMPNDDDSDAGYSRTVIRQKPQEARSVQGAKSDLLRIVESE
jgi:chromosome segregation ATPase